jgi:hypothetical protein
MNNNIPLHTTLQVQVRHDIPPTPPVIKDKCNYSDLLLLAINYYPFKEIGQNKMAYILI